MSMLSAVSMLYFFPVFSYQKAETLGGVVVSGRLCVPFGNAGMIDQNPLLLIFIAFSVDLNYIENIIVLRFMNRLIWFI